MTDFYSLLKQSILERDIRDSAAREAVYSQAREAIIKQLWAYQPPLAADEIDTRVGAYDSAVERIEADLSVAFAEATPRAEKPAAASKMRDKSGGRRPPPEKAQPEPEPIVAEEDEAPPIADWHGDIADLVYDEDEQEPVRVPRARAAAAEARLAYDEDAAYTDDEPAPRTTTGGTAVATRAQSERWADNGMETEATSRMPWLSRLGRNESERIQVLGGAIAGLVVALGLFGGYMLFFRADGGVTLDVNTRREVSDAATATRIANEQTTVEQTYTLFDGRDPTIFVSTPDNPVRFVSDAGGFARVSSTASAPGVKVHVGPGLAARLAGREVRVTIVARAAPENGALNMRFAYQSGLAVSHWQTANLDATYEAVAMRWRPPAMQTEGGDYLLIEPGIPGDGTAVDIQSVQIDVLGNTPT